MVECTSESSAIVMLHSVLSFGQGEGGMQGRGEAMQEKDFVYHS